MSQCFPFGLLYTSEKLKFIWFSRGSKKRTPQLAFTCSKSTIEALENGVKYVQS